MLHDADVAGNHIDNAAGDEERRDLSRTTGKKLVVVVLDRRETADTGPHRDTDPVTVFLGDLQPGIPERINTGSDTVVHENVHATGIPFVHVPGDVEVRNRPRDLCRKTAGVEGVEPADTAPAFADILPGGFQVVANRGNDPHAGYDDTSLAQLIIREFVAGLPSSEIGY